MLTSHVGALVQDLVTLLTILLSGNMPVKWWLTAHVPVTLVHTGSTDEALGFWLRFRSALGAVGIWGVNQSWMISTHSPCTDKKYTGNRRQA